MPLKNKISLLVLLLALGSAGDALAQIQEKIQGNASLSDSNDCSNISVDYQNDPNLTQQERIELMDKALFHSLSKYESCQNSRSASGGGGANGGQAGADGGADGGAGSGGSGASTASAEMSGTEAPATQETSTGGVSDQANANAQSIDEETNAPAKTMRAKGSGKTPDDIPPVDNDSVLEAQIREAAMSEQDPLIKAKLWNEYRKYKGLPVKKP